MAVNEKRRTLVTGSRGMVGGTISRLAKEAGWEIFSPSRQELDLRDPKSTLEYLQVNGITSVIHCAAKVGGISANMTNPADFILENLQIDTSVFSSSRSLGIPELIYLGSSCMYPRETSQPMKVEQILSSGLEPTNEGYALAKIAGAKTVSLIASQDSLDWRVIIPSNLYGPRDNFDPLNSHLIPAVVRKVHHAVKRNLDIIEIWGDGEARREFTFVGDLASFIVENLTQLKRWPLMMNVGFGQDFSVNDYYRHTAKLLGYSGKFVHNLNKPVGMKQKLMDSEVARSYGWNPKTGLESGLMETINWFEESSQYE
jgi:GDP-L-fucose synthase